MNKYLIIGTIAALAVVSAAHAQNYTFPSNLTLGSSGPDVTNLQTWLIANGYDIPALSSGAQAKGYFGQQTKSALIRYQTAIGLPALGFFGPLTRARFGQGGGSGGGTTGGGNTAAPLRVVSPNGGESWRTGTVQNISWTSPAYIQATYVDIRLLRQFTCTTQICPMIAFAPYTIASGLPINQGSYSWTVGNVIPLIPMAAANSPYQVAPDGQYMVQICQSGTSNCDSSDSTFTIYSSGNPGNVGSALVLNGIDAPTALAIGQTGTWTVHASDPQNGTLNYSVDWGDQQIKPLLNASITAAGSAAQAASFTHSYNSSGLYTITFTVRNNAGLTAQSKITVSVGTTANSQLINVTSPNGGESWKLGTQQTITWTGLSSVSSNYNYVYNSSGNVRITLDYRCPAGMYCTAIARPTYIIQSSAPNSGQSVWNVGAATTDGTTGTTVPVGTYVMTVCRYDNSATPTACDSSDSYFTITN